MPRIAFQPTPDQLAQLAEDLASPDLSLREAAARHNTTLDALTLYLTSDAGLAHLANLELAAAVRTRLTATSNLHRAVASLTGLLDDYCCSRSAPDSLNAPRHDASAAPEPAQPDSDLPAPASPSLLLIERQRDRARRAAYLLFRLATYTPRPLAGLRAPTAQQAAPAPTPSPAHPPHPAPISSPARRTTTPAQRPVPNSPVPAIHSSLVSVPGPACLPALPALDFQTDFPALSPALPRCSPVASLLQSAGQAAISQRPKRPTQMLAAAGRPP